MLESLTDLLIGATGTVIYLYAWNRILAGARPAAEAGETEVARARWRSRLWQVVFFLLLTPYVLFLFYLMQLLQPGSPE